MNMTLKHVHVTIGAMEEQYILHILSVCVCTLSYLACNTHTLDYTAICLPLPYFSTLYLINGTIIRKRVLNMKCVF